MVGDRAVPRDAPSSAKVYRSLAVLAAIFLFCSTAPGRAQSVASWAGPYLGIDVGGRVQDTGAVRLALAPYVYPNLSYRSLPTPVSGSRAGNLDATPTGAVRAGFFWPAMPVVVGLEVEGAAGWTHGLASTTVAFPDRDIGQLTACGSGTLGCLSTQTDALQIKTSLGWTGSLRARIGLPLADQWLLSGFLGPAFAVARTTMAQQSAGTSQFIFFSNPGGIGHFLTNQQPISASVSAKHTQLLAGITTGASLDYRIDSEWMIRGEYGFMSFERMSTRLVGPGGSASSFSTSPALHTFRVGLAYLF